MSSENGTGRANNRARLNLQTLEDRTVPSVTAWLSGSVLKLAGNSANDWISVDLTGDKVWYNGTGLSAAQYVSQSQLSGIDISGGSGNDTIQVQQTANFPKPIRLFGGDGGDQMKIDLRADASAKYSADGQTGTDTVTVPGWMPDGPNGFPSSLWTNAEYKNFSTLSQAQATLRGNSVMTSYTQQLGWYPITNGPGNRSAAGLNQVIEQFELGYYSHQRYQYDGYTKCNVAVVDITRALQVGLPTKNELGGVDGGGDMAAGAVRLNQYMNAGNGWRRIDLNNPADRAVLLDSAKAGKPVIASTATPNHIAVLRSDQTLGTLTLENLGDLVIAQAGAKNFTKGRLADVTGWVAAGLQNVQFFVRAAESPAPSVSPPVSPPPVSPPTSPTTGVLQNNVPVFNLSGAQGSQQFFRIAVPAGQQKLEFKISGGNGDADLYVRRGSSPTLNDWDFRPYLDGNNETVTITNPAAGDWYVMLVGYGSYSGVSLNAAYLAPAAAAFTLSYTQTGTGQYSFFWNDLPNESSYRVWYRVNGSGWGSVPLPANLTGSSWSMGTGLQWDFYVSALDSSGNTIATTNTVSFWS